MAQIDFAEVLLFTDRDPSSLGLDTASQIRVIPIAKIESSEAYSRFMLESLADHITTSHCLIVQWDGHVIDAQRWQSEFLDYDYIGASWPQFDDGHDVGNGGFSLRSRRLLEACQTTGFQRHHPEDVAICRTNRGLLEDQGMKFAPLALADQFSAERSGDAGVSFGYHGVFLMPPLLGIDEFWKVYEDLSDRGTVWTDFDSLLASAVRGSSGLSRGLRLMLDRLRCFMSR
ncbi:MAG: DUF5672 family protein [Pseudomonadota bacterium]